MIRTVGRPSTDAAVRVAVRAGEGHAGRVIVQLVEIDVEGAHRVHDEGREQRRPIGTKQVIQRPPETVIIDRLDVGRPGS